MIATASWVTLVVAAAVLAVVLLACRWTFGTGRRRARPERDFGLLVTVGSAQNADAAREMLGRLAAAGLRGTLAFDRPGPVLVDARGSEVGRAPGRCRVLVFPSDAPRARQVLLDDGAR